jgi:non-canonical purine NTP pyrophosphatase (RdgB/HAM1 family)
MKSIIFATGNSRKIQEASKTLEPFAIQVQPQSVDIHEIQHSDASEIAKHKAKAAFSVLQRPVVVSDTSWSIPALGGFPGGYMKDIANWWRAEDWLQLMARHDDKTILCHEHVAYFDGEQVMHFEHAYSGYFISEPRGGHKYEDVSSIEQVVCLYSDRTMAEMHDDTGIASAGDTLHHWLQFGEWYKSR